MGLFWFLGSLVLGVLLIPPVHLFSEALQDEARSDCVLNPNFAFERRKQRSLFHQIGETG